MRPRVFSLAPRSSAWGEGRGEGQTLAPALVAAPHPNPLPILKENGEREFRLSAVFADDGDGADVALGEAAEIVGEAEHGLLLPLALAGAALHLQVHFVDHAQARSADRVAEALEAAVDLAGHLAVRVVEAVEHVLDGAAFGRDV